MNPPSSSLPLSISMATNYAINPYIKEEDLTSKSFAEGQTPPRETNSISSEENRKKKHERTNKSARQALSLHLPHRDRPKQARSDSSIEKKATVKESNPLQFLSEFAKSEGYSPREVPEDRNEKELFVNLQKAPVDIITSLKLQNSEEQFLISLKEKKWNQKEFDPKQIKEVFMLGIQDQIKKLNPTGFLCTLDLDQVEFFTYEFIDRVHNTLLEDSKIRELLLNLIEHLTNHFLHHKCKTPFMQLTYDTLKDLALLAAPDKKTSIFYPAKFVNKVKAFLDTLLLIENLEYVPNKKKQIENDQKLRQVVVDLFGGDLSYKETINSLKFHADWPNMVELSRPFVRERLYQSVKTSIKRLKNKWTEPASLDGFFKSTDKIALKDVFEYYFREDPISIPIIINNETFNFVKNSKMEARYDYFLQLIKKMYEAAGFNITSIEDEVKTLLSKKCDPSKLSKEMQQCLRSLKMGGVDAWNKAWWFLSLRLDGLFKNENNPHQSLLLKSENEKLVFHIDKKNFGESHVRQTRKFQIFLYKNQINLVEIPVFWKLFIPHRVDDCDFWKFELQLRSLSVTQIVKDALNKKENQDLTDDLRGEICHIMRQIQTAFVNLKPDGYIEDKIRKMNEKQVVELLKQQLISKEITEKEAITKTKAIPTMPRIKIGHSFMKTE